MALESEKIFQIDGLRDNAVAVLSTADSRARRRGRRPRQITPAEQRRLPFFRDFERIASDWYDPDQCQ